jgi:hypothetical protein
VIPAFINVEFNEEAFLCPEKSKLLAIYALGYEARSGFLFDKTYQIIDPIKDSLLFCFEGYEEYTFSEKKIGELRDIGVQEIVVKYDDHKSVLSATQARVNEHHQRTKDPLIVHIDYSSMPRGWYCRLLLWMLRNLRTCDKCFFWYSKGSYITQTAFYPSAGVNEIEVFSGKASLRPDNARSHILGLGYDHVRSQAIRAVLDPSYYAACYAFPKDDVQILNKIQSENEELFSSAAFSFALPVDHFPFMVSKLLDVTSSLIGKGDVVIVPDGPKPLILASSIIPELMNNEGVVCLLVKRHEDYFEPVDVIPTGEVFGFSFFGTKND